MEENLEAEKISKLRGKSFTDVRAICGYAKGEMLALKSSKEHGKIDEIQKGFEGSKFININRRKNPQKSWWVTSDGKHEGFFCNQCGKEFKSLKALFGHLRLHPKRKAGLQQEDVKMPNLARKKRSEMKFKSNTCLSNKSSLSNFNPSCSSMIVTNVDEELQDTAACLLMLAKGGFYPNDEIACDDKSLIVRPNLPIESTSKKNEDDHRDDDGSEGVVDGPAISESGLNSCDLESGHVHVSFMEKMAESNSCHSKNVKFELNRGETEKPFIEDITRTNGSTVEGIFLKQHKKKKCNVCSKFFHSDQVIHGHQFHCPTSCEYHPSKTTACVETNSETNILFCSKDYNGTKSKGRNRMKKWMKYQCLVCFKAFPSGQALGGHKRAHFHGNCMSKEKEALALIDGGTTCQEAVDASDLEIPVAVHEQEALEVLVPDV